MKKIVLGVATVLLSLGLLAGCNNDDVDDKINNTGPEENEPTDEGNEGTTDTGPGPEEGGSGSGYYFGFESDDVLYYITGDTIARGDYCGEVTTDINEAVEVTFEVDTEVENAYYISFKYEEVEHWITIVAGDYTNLSYATEKAPIYLHTDGEAEYFGDESGENFLCYNSTYGCLYSSSVQQYITSSPVAGIYTASGELVAGGVGKTPEPLPEIDPNDLTVVETGKLGLYQGGKGNYYYFTGTINSSGYGVLSTSWEEGVSVTELSYEEYVVLRIGEADSYQYIGAKDVNASGVALYDEPYALTYDDTYDAFLTAYGERFIGTYGTYETLSWSDASKYLGEDDQYAAQLYTTEQKLPAPTSENIKISGPTSVYVGSTITLTATVDAGYDQSIIWSTESTGIASVDAETGVVTGVAEGTATIKATSGADTNAYKEYTISVVALPEGTSLLGTFDFSSCTGSATTMTESSGLDSYWNNAYSQDLYVEARIHELVYLGNGSASGSAFDGVSTLIKLGTTSANGTLQLKFATGTQVSQVVVTAHSWNTSTVRQLSVNGVSQDCSITGTATELTYDITDPTFLVTFESTYCVTIHSIAIYGSYDESNIASVTALTLSSDTEETLNVGEEEHISVAWEPADKAFDIDELVWATSSDDVASITQTVNGATIHAQGAGTATITATALNGVSGTISIEVKDDLQESETFVMSQLGYENAEVVSEIDGHQIKITLSQGTHTNSSPAYYASGTALRWYTGNTITFTGTYENAPIASIVITYPSNYAGSFSITNGTSSEDSSALTYTLVPTENATDDMVITCTSGGRISQITVNYTLEA